VKKQGREEGISQWILALCRHSQCRRSSSSSKSSSKRTPPNRAIKDRQDSKNSQKDASSAVHLAPGEWNKTWSKNKTLLQRLQAPLVGSLTEFLSSSSKYLSEESIWSILQPSEQYHRKNGLHEHEHATSQCETHIISQALHGSQRRVRLHAANVTHTRTVNSSKYVRVYFAERDTLRTRSSKSIASSTLHFDQCTTVKISHHCATARTTSSRSSSPKNFHLLQWIRTAEQIQVSQV
jgi:hypothetical protein